MLPSELECILTYCDNATHIPNENGANYNFSWDGELIPLYTDLAYPCKAGMRLENSTHYKGQASNMSVVSCGGDGEMKYPAEWPQCSADIECGDPPSNTEGGSRLWVVGEEWDSNYRATIAYRCFNGSKFDTSGNGLGDTLEIAISCRWNKLWDPWPVLPPCYITDCVDPYPVPEDTFLEVVRTSWTPVNTSKQYRCQGMREDGSHTRFWESNRSRSIFDMFCKPDGFFHFENIRENWPTCVEGLYFLLLFLITFFL